MEGSVSGLRLDVVQKSICSDGDERQNAQGGRCVDGDLNPSLPLEPTCCWGVRAFVCFRREHSVSFRVPTHEYVASTFCYTKRLKIQTLKSLSLFYHGYVRA